MWVEEGVWLLFDFVVDKLFEVREFDFFDNYYDFLFIKLIIILSSFPTSTAFPFLYLFILSFTFLHFCYYSFISFLGSFLFFRNNLRNDTGSNSLTTFSKSESQTGSNGKREVELEISSNVITGHT